MRVLFILFLLTLASCNSITEKMEGFEVHGIDVSRYQSDIDWPMVARQDITFAFVKASEGETISDKFFCKNWNEMKKAGIRRGAYHFFRPQTPVYTQVKNFIDNVYLEKGDLPPVLDIEVLDGIGTEDLVKRVRHWLELVEAEYQIRPIIYTNLKFYNKHLADSFSDYPVWIARYNQYFEPTLVNEVEWKFWQYGNRGRVKGIEGNVDLNVFKGTLDDLEMLCYNPQSFSLQ